MLIVATFKHSTYLELALNLLEQRGIAKDCLLVAPLENLNGDSYSEFQTARRDGKSTIDKLFITATIFMLLGSIYGFVLKWGPIIWAMIGIVIGAFIGWIWDYILHRKETKTIKESESEVVLIISCNALNSETVEQILWSHHALGIAKIPSYEESDMS